MDYESDIYIDETSLDVEWLEQPELMLKYAKLLSDARKKLDYAKEALEYTKAELDKNIRTAPEKYGIERITEAVVASTVVMQPEYATASEAMIEAKYEADIAYGVVKAIDSRKDALENLVRLYGQQYFAGPQIPRDIKEERNKKHDAGVAQKLKRKR